jgi:hypothetical protein
MSAFRERQRFLRDLAYVFEQAKAFHQFYATGAHKCLSEHSMFQTVRNALLESSLSFLRKINEFFGGNRDISVSDYLPGESKRWLFSKEDSKLLNDRVMHLSLDEAKYGKIDWDEFFQRNLPEAQRRFDAFVIQLRREHPEYFSCDDSLQSPPV